MADAALFARYQRASTTAAELAQRAVQAHVRLALGMGEAEAEAYLSAVYPTLVRQYGEAAAEAAREHYQAERDASSAPGTEEAYEAVAARPVAEEWALEDVAKARREGFDTLPGRAVSRVLQRADRTMAYNVARDPAKPRWAVVPHPGACGWCVMVASNGWAYSEESADAQRHDNCKCTIACEFDRDNPSLAGYDVEDLRRQYQQGLEDAGNIRKRWESLTPEEQAKYKRGKRSAYETFKASQVANAIDESRARVSEYQSRVGELQRRINAATKGAAKKDDYLWSNQVGELISSLEPGAGSITVQPHAEFKAVELLDAVRLAEAGHDIEIIRASGRPGSHTPDFLVDGVPMELKQLTVSSVSRLGKRIWEASAQSREVIIDLSLETLPRSVAMAKVEEEISTPHYRYLSRYEISNGVSRGERELRVDAVTLVMHNEIITIARHE